jgi:hypothetical protein
LLWLLARRPVEGLTAVGQLDPEDLEGLLAGPVFALAASLADVPPDVLPGVLRERLTEPERAVLDRANAPAAQTASPEDCVHALKRLRYERELAAIQQDIERLDDGGGPGRDEALAALWARKKDLLRRLEGAA